MGRWDRSRVDQVLTNLVSNALKYGRGKPVVVRVGQSGDRAVLAVADQGIGIAAGDLARILVPRGEQSDVRAAERKRHAKRLSLSDHDVRAARSC